MAAEVLLGAGGGDPGSQARQRDPPRCSAPKQRDLEGRERCREREGGAGGSEVGTQLRMGQKRGNAWNLVR